MQGQLGRHVTRSRHRLVALSILTFAVAMVAVQIRSTFAEKMSSADKVSSFKVDNLIGSKGTHSRMTDSKMINPWGATFIAVAKTPFWINDEGTGVSELIDGKGKIFKALPFVTVPGATVGSTGKPTGIVGNITGQFVIPGSTTALFIFATEEGTIAAWNESLGATATTVVTNAGEVYTGLAMAMNGSANMLYAANSNGSIDAFDSNFNPVTTTGGFVDPSLPTGLTPYNITALNNDLFVTYSMGVQPVGQVDQFDAEGNLIMSFTDPSLNAPWGVAIAPSHFGSFSNDLLVGNKGDGTISVFNPVNGEFLGQLEDHDGQPIVIQDLWSLLDGAGALNAKADSLYFTAGTGGYAEGVFGTIESGPPVKQAKTKDPKTTSPTGPYTIDPMPTTPQMPQMPMM
jgi:uncharacterized protein (TIGR03118 family)